MTHAVVPYRRRVKASLPADFDVRRDNVPAGTSLYAAILARRVPGRNVYLHPGAAQVYELKTADVREQEADEPEPEEYTSDDKSTSYFRPLYPWGCARLTAVVVFQDHEAPAGERRCYEIEARGVTAVSSRKELHSGEWAERPGVPGVTSRGAHAIWADILEYQEHLCGPIPIHQGRTGTGWGEVDGKHAHALPNGVWFGEHGPLPDAKAYMHLAAEHLAPYAELDAATLADVYAHPDTEAQAAALRFRAEIAGRHLALLIDAAFLDSVLYPLHRPDYGVLVRGPSGRGKTITSGSGRCYFGRFGTIPPAPATGSFFDTGASVERHATQLKHEPTTIDDLVIRDEDTATDKAMKARTVRAILHSVGNGTPVRRRMTHHMQEQPAYKFETVPVLTSEQLLPDMAESDLNRAVVLRFDELGIVDLDRLKGEGPRHEAGMLGAGLNYLAHIARRWNAEGDAFSQDLRQRHVAYTEQVRTAMLQARGEQPLPSEADRLPSNGAHLLLALSVMQDACTAAGVPYTFDLDAIRADLVAELVAQVELIQALMTGSHNGVPFSDWVGGVLRRLIDEGQRHVMTPDGELPDARYLPIQAVRLGWRERGYIVDPDTGRRRPDMRPQGALLAVTSQKCQYLCAEKHTLFDVLSEAARRAGRPFPATADEMLREFDRYGMIARDNDDKHLERHITINGKHPRRVWIARHVVWPELHPPSTTNSVGKVGKVGNPDETPQPDGAELVSEFPTRASNFPTEAPQVGKFDASPDGAQCGPVENFPTFPTFPTPLDVQSTLAAAPDIAELICPLCGGTDIRDYGGDLLCYTCGAFAVSRDTGKSTRVTIRPRWRDRDLEDGAI